MCTGLHVCPCIQRPEEDNKYPAFSFLALFPETKTFTLPEVRIRDRNPVIFLSLAYIVLGFGHKYMSLSRFLCVFWSCELRSSCLHSIHKLMDVYLNPHIFTRTSHTYAKTLFSGVIWVWSNFKKQRRGCYMSQYLLLFFFRKHYLKKNHVIFHGFVNSV